MKHTQKFTHSLEGRDHGAEQGFERPDRNAHVERTLERHHDFHHAKLTPFLRVGERAVAEQEMEESRLEGGEQQELAERRERLWQQEHHVRHRHAEQRQEKQAHGALPGAQKIGVAEGMGVSALETGAAAVTIPYVLNTAVTTGIDWGAASAAVTAHQPALAGLALAKSAAGLAFSASIPAATGVAGYFIGKKLGHPTVGALTGTAVGAGGATVASSFLASGLGAIGTGALLVGGAGIASAVGGAAYGLGRWHSRVWGSRPGGVLRNIGRGLISPISIPIGYARKRQEQ